MASPSQRVDKDRERRQLQLEELRRTRQALRDQGQPPVASSTSPTLLRHSPLTSTRWTPLDTGTTATRDGVSSTLQHSSSLTGTRGQASARDTDRERGATASFQERGLGGLGQSRREMSSHTPVGGSTTTPSWLGGGVTAPLNEVLDTDYLRSYGRGGLETAGSAGGGSPTTQRSESPLSRTFHVGNTDLRPGATAVAPPDVWECEVVTGDDDHAGTKAGITLDVYGEKGCATGVHLAPSMHHEKFARGSTVKLKLELANDNLGTFLCRSLTAPCRNNKYDNVSMSDKLCIIRQRYQWLGSSRHLSC